MTKFVAAPSRDHVPRADDGAEPARDLDQKLVTGAVRAETCCR